MSIESRGWIKPHSSKFTFLARCLDSALVIVSLWTVSPTQFGIIRLEEVASGILAALFLQFSGEFAEIYRSWRSETIWSEARQVLFCWFGSFSLLLLISGMFIEIMPPKMWSVYMQWFVLSLMLLLGWRLVARNLLALLREQGFNTRHIAVVGSSELAQEAARHLLNCSWAGYTFAGFYDDRHNANSHLPHERRLREQDTSVSQHAGDLNKLVQDARSGLLDCIFIALPLNAELRIQRLVSELTNSTASVYLIPDLFTFELVHSRSMNLNGIPAISIVGEPHRGIQSMLKRLEDLLGATLILLLTGIPMLIIALAIKFTSTGPVFFRQTRYGLDGKSFKVWKFRTMNVCEDDIGQIRQAQRGDDRVTPLGRFLRSTSLDELPQVFNVLQGTMSIVGPRPHAVAHNELYRGRIKGYMLRHKIKPGITGWAQVNGWRGETDTLEKMQKRVEFDLHYIRHWSLTLDMKILLLTLIRGFRNANAY